MVEAGTPGQIYLDMSPDTRSAWRDGLVDGALQVSHTGAAIKRQPAAFSYQGCTPFAIASPEYVLVAFHIITAQMKEIGF